LGQRQFLACVGKVQANFTILNFRPLAGFDAMNASFLESSKEAFLPKRGIPQIKSS